jgi:hypothetical protein
MENSVVRWVNIGAFKKGLHNSLVIKASKTPFFLALDHHRRLALSVLFLAHCPHRRLGACTRRWQFLHLAHLAVGTDMTAISYACMPSAKLAAARRCSCVIAACARTFASEATHSSKYWHLSIFPCSSSASQHLPGFRNR